MFQSEPLQNSIDMSVYVEVNVANKPLHCPIKLTGIDPKTTVYINQPLPPPPPIVSLLTFVMLPT